MLEPVGFDPGAPHATPSAGARRFLDDGRSRVEAFLRERGQSAFGLVPCDYDGLWGAFAAVERSGGIVERFCEWGAGFGVVCGAASLMGWESWGIEIRAELVAEARALHADHGLSVEMLEGSFLPAEWDGEELAPADAVTVLSGAGTVDEVDVDVDDFDVVFAFPWPGEEDLYFDVFDRFAADGARLLTYHGPAEGFALKRKL